MNFTTEDLIKNLPWTTTPQRSVADEVLPALAVFGAGLIVGAGLGVLFAPRSGRELRSNIADRTAELVDKLPSVNGIPVALGH
jgi:hypothetical protein